MKVTLCFVLLFALASLLLAQETEKLSLLKYLPGKWDVTTLETSTETGEIIGSPHSHRMTLYSSNNNVVGSYIEKNEEVQVKIDLEPSALSGEYLLSRNEEVPVPLFAFDFQNISGNFISSGKWQGEEGSSYLFTFSSPFYFLITITNPTEKKVVTILSKKFLEPIEQSFFQKYGMFFVFILLIGVQMWAKTKEAAVMRQRVPEERGPRVEEIDEDNAAADTPDSSSKKDK